MTGLREKKKERTRAAILAAATDLFTENGFENSTMEQVAKIAEVGVGTLYNYFGSKNVLLLALAEDGTRELLARGEAVVKKPATDPIAAVTELMVTYSDVATMFDKKVLRELFAAGFSSARELMPGLMQLDMMLVSQLSVLLAELQQRGDIDASLNLDEAALALYGGMGVPLFMYISADELDLDGLRAMVRGQVRLLFTGLLPREATR